MPNTRSILSLSKGASRAAGPQLPPSVSSNTCSTGTPKNLAIRIPSHFFRSVVDRSHKAW